MKPLFNPLKMSLFSSLSIHYWDSLYSLSVNVLRPVPSDDDIFDTTPNVFYKVFLTRSLDDKPISLIPVIMFSLNPSMGLSMISLKSVMIPLNRLRGDPIISMLTKIFNKFDFTMLCMFYSSLYWKISNLSMLSWQANYWIFIGTSLIFKNTFFHRLWISFEDLFEMEMLKLICLTISIFIMIQFYTGLLLLPLNTSHSSCIYYWIISIVWRSSCIWNCWMIR